MTQTFFEAAHPAAVDWFNAHASLPVDPTEGWFPQTYRVGLSPVLPPDSLLDGPSALTLSDYVGEIDIHVDERTGETVTWWP